MRHRNIISIFLSAFLLVFSMSLVLPASPVLAQTLTLSGHSGTPGTLVSVSGSNYTANATFSVIFGYGSTFPTTVRQGLVAPDGTISTSFNVPQIPGGSYTVRVETSASNGATDFSVSPSVTLTASPFHVGDQVTVFASGFGSGTTASISYDATSIATATTSVYGTFTLNFDVPPSTTGPHSVIVTDSTATQSATLAVEPFIRLIPTSGAVGTLVTILGTGFQANRLVTITYASATITTNPSSITTSNVGSFSATFTVPPTSLRSALVVAGDNLSSSATFSIVAGISLSQNSGSVGTQLSVNGTGFTPGAQITIKFDNTQVVLADAGTDGGFTAGFNIPPSTAGMHLIMASDSYNSISANFVVQPAISLTPNSGKVGTQIALVGSGFAASQPIRVNFDDSQVTTTNSDGNGSFTASLNAPASFGGQHSISASDGNNTASGSFSILPSLSISSASGQMGAQITVSGSGFGKSRPVNIRLGNIQLNTAATDSQGNFSSNFTVPQLDTGSYDLTVNDSINSASVVFVVTTSFTISPTIGNIGSTVTVKGSGFSGTVTVKYDETVVGTAIAIPNGAISVNFTVPVSIHGDHIITVSDTSVSLQAIFTVESTPPPTPALLKPPAGSRQGTHPTFTWQPVIDPSGVTYTLQISLNSNFTVIVLEKTGLIAPQYALANTDKLPATGQNSPYYWRVRAVDLASNQGDWSTAGSFYVSLLPDWAKYTLIGVGAVAAAALLFWLGLRAGRRPRPKPPEQEKQSE